MSLWIEAIGTVSGAISLVAWLPQLKLTWQTRKAGDISWSYLVAVVASIQCWVHYGSLKGSASLVATQVVGGALVGALMVFKVRADRDTGAAVRVAAASVAVAAVILSARGQVPVEFIGTVGGCIALAAWLPQLARTYRTRSAADLSLAYLLAGLSSSAGFILYGLLIDSASLIVTQIPNCGLVVSLILLKLRHAIPAVIEVTEYVPEPIFGAPETP
ncbi:uncharacterized protein with PQ loop repeat [Nocardia tenerifensis]|uniref:Uncharacterized protein with PQ loop repeat n=1 Tax=Nocardia tenerifensis TaxID=228006 RepID=A0A318JUJ9_9NOCA|nr:PQ-loop domain-containing transporter [Nocardia tenerifensis]PXX59332.1 uncharacterized protein with PQ loop repeat [Nocardia tenerifensis]